MSSSWPINIRPTTRDAYTAASTSATRPNKSRRHADGSKKCVWYKNPILIGTCVALSTVVILCILLVVTIGFSSNTNHANGRGGGGGRKHSSTTTLRPTVIRNAGGTVLTPAPYPTHVHLLILSISRPGGVDYLHNLLRLITRLQTTDRPADMTVSLSVFDADMRLPDGSPKRPWLYELGIEIVRAPVAERQAFLDAIVLDQKKDKYHDKSAFILSRSKESLDYAYALEYVQQRSDKYPYIAVLEVRLQSSHVRARSLLVCHLLTLSLLSCSPSFRMISG